MRVTSILQQLYNYGSTMDFLEFSSLVFGLLCVYFLIKENILTFICGIIYVIISFFIFWEARLYGDFLLHIIFLLLNIYGWYNWVKGSSPSESELKVTSLDSKNFVQIIVLTLLGVLVFAQILKIGPSLIEGMEPASLPLWDSVTSVLSVTGMWLTTKKKIQNWYFWFIVDILATGIYFYKELYFYSLLYFVYIFLAVAGYLAWRKSMSKINLNKSYD